MLKAQSLLALVLSVAATVWINDHVHYFLKWSRGGAEACASELMLLLAWTREHP